MSTVLTTASFNRTILLRAEPNIFEDVCGSSAIKPGYLLRRLIGQPSNSPVVIPHDKASGRGAVRVATEQVLNQGSTVDTAYAAGDIVRCHVGHGGQLVKMVLKANHKVVPGTPLISNGDGTLIPSADTDTIISTEQVIGESIDSLDLTVSSAVDTLVAVLLW